MKRLLLLCMTLCICLVGCGEKHVTRSSFMMDTVISYDITCPDAGSVIDECDRMIAELEKIFSAHINSSLVSEFNKNGMVSDLPSHGEFEDIVMCALDVCRQTDGAFDITVAPLVWKWDIPHAAENWTPPSDSEITELLSHVGFDKLSLGLTSLTGEDEKTEIDLGGIAKGYTLGYIADKLKNEGAVGTLSFGGNIALIGEKKDGKPWGVGIKNPFDTSDIIGTLSLDSGIVSVSGSYERYVEYAGKTYHHIIDPKTGYPARSDLVSVAVWVDTADLFCDVPLVGAYADALSTALFVMGHDAALEHYYSVKRGDIKSEFIKNISFEAVLIKADGTVTVTDGLHGRYTPDE